MQRLGSILAQMKLPGPGPLQLRQIDAALADVFGAAAKGVRAASFKRGRLVLEVKSAARAFEYQAFSRAELVQKLKRRPGFEQLAEVSFKNGSWRSHGHQ